MKHNKTIVQHTKDDPFLINYIPIALANTVYKLFTNTLTSLLTSSSEKHKPLHVNQEGFGLQQNITTQIQMILASYEDIRFTNNDVELKYVDI